VLAPLAPAATLLQRLGSQMAAVLDAHGTPAEFIDAELQEMNEVRLGKPPAAVSSGS
jgi:tRNA G26 N,N-dimethylase Trm1